MWHTIAISVCLPREMRWRRQSVKGVSAMRDGNVANQWRTAAVAPHAVAGPQVNAPAGVDRTDVPPQGQDAPASSPWAKSISSYDKQIQSSSRYLELRKIVEPASEELQARGLWDTSGEYDDTVMPGLQHKYPQTALVLATNECFAYCQFCFRKRLLVEGSREIACDCAAIARYIQERPEINNVLLSGGDPLVLGTDQLQEMVRLLLPIPHLKAIRFGTRAMAYCPERFRDPALAMMLNEIIQAGKTPILVNHVDHFDEVSPEAETHILALRGLGVQLLNQAVLLKDVNDAPEVLAATFGKLQRLGVHPYYLFQPRPAKGAVHFQVPIRRGLEIVQALTRCLSGLEKTFRYVMSHRTGKIEILDLDDAGQLYLRYHQCKDARKIGRVFTRPYREGDCWLDDRQ
jgi:KamA family protein